MMVIVLCLPYLGDGGGSAHVSYFVVCQDLDKRKQSQREVRRDFRVREPVIAAVAQVLTACLPCLACLRALVVCLAARPESEWRTTRQGRCVGEQYHAYGLEHLSI